MQRREPRYLLGGPPAKDLPLLDAPISDKSGEGSIIEFEQQRGPRLIEYGALVGRRRCDASREGSGRTG
jgi:hypothetical protein